MKRRVGRIEILLARKRWADARREIRAALRLEPESHWFWTRLGLTYYETRDYDEALRCEKKALQLAPKCPLALWDHACTLEQVGRYDDAIRIHRSLIRRGVDEIAHGECGEGRSWARGLLADSHFRLSQIYQALGKKRQSIEALIRHLDERGPGCRSIYPLDNAKEQFTQLKRWRPTA